MGKSNKGSVMLILIILLAVFVVVGLIMYTISDGIIDILEGSFKENIGAIATKVSDFFTQVFHIEFEGQTKTYIMGKHAVGELKQNLELSGVDVEACGLTEIRLKKTLIAEYVSKSFGQTLCAVSAAPYYEEDLKDRANYNASNQAVSNPESDSDFVRIKDFIPTIRVDLAYATSNNFTGKVIYSFKDGYLRYGTVKKLKQAQDELAKSGYGIVIWDAFRPVAGQTALFEAYPDPTYVAKGAGPHCRGNTVDITLCNLQTGELLEMPTKFDDFSAKADRNYSDCTAKAAENSKLLENVMEKYGFTPYSAEWWHYQDETSYEIEENFYPNDNAVATQQVVQQAAQQVTGETEAKDKKSGYKFKNKPATREEEIKEMENEILQNVKQKDKYKNIKTLQEFLDNPVHKKSSKDLWPGADVDYTLYFDSDSFFYFQDTENIFGNGQNEWYLASMGAIKIGKEDSGTMKYADPETFAKMGENFENSINDFIAGNQNFNEQEILNIYTDGDEPNTIKVWNLDVSKTKYIYEFQNDNINGGEPVIIEGEDYGDTYKPEVQQIDLETRVNVSSFAISTELIIDLLNVTASGEFIETFIDYALGHIKVGVVVHQLKDESVTYCKEEYQIKDNFIFEAYDFMDIGKTELADIGNDNFEAYADIVYNRLYNGNKFEGTVANLLKTEEINKAGELKGEVTISAEEIQKKVKENANIDINEVLRELIGDDEKQEDRDGITKQKFLENIESKIEEALKDETVNEGLSFAFGVASDKISETIGGMAEAVFDGKEYKYTAKYRVMPLKAYLKTAYDPGSNFELGEINVREIKEITTNSLNYDISVSSTSTWYGDVINSEPEKKYTYSIMSAGEFSETDEEGYNAFSSDDLKFDTNATEEVEKIRISANIASQYPSIKDDPKVVYQALAKGGADIADNILDYKPGEFNQSNFENCTESGLFELSTIDKGEYNNNFGAFVGCDYIYTKYEKDIDKYKEGTKTRKQVMSTSNVKQEVADTTEAKLNTFLGLLKNDDGTIPTSGNWKTFKKDGKVVLYGDIYNGHSPAGDLLLDNGALMLFELLEKGETTQGLVNVFKYLAYLYTGTDYGVTSVDQLSYSIIFGLNSMTGMYGNTVEEKLWFLLKNLGYSDYAAAGVLGNIDVETGGAFDPEKIEGRKRRRSWVVPMVV